MFLCDTIAHVVDAASDREFRQTMDLIPGSESMRRVLGLGGVILREYDLFTFDRSALIAAGDLRIDKQMGLEAIGDMIFQKRRKIYIEADYADRQLAFSKIPTITTRQSPLVGDPVRIATLLDIHGEGKATLRLMWSTPARDGVVLDRTLIETLNIKKGLQKDLKKLSVLNAAMFKVDVDMSAKCQISLQEFEQECEVEGTRANLILLDHGRIRGGDQGQKNRSTVIREAYDLFRLNSICSIEFDEAARQSFIELASNVPLPPEQVRDTLMSDLDGEIVFAMAMGALLEIDDLKIENRKERIVKHREVGGKKKTFKTPINTGPRPKLSVVNLNLSHDIVDAIYRPISYKDNLMISLNNRQGPVLHPVRGHMFKARNGKIVYRAAHWRGKDVERRLTRVKS